MSAVLAQARLVWAAGAKLGEGATWDDRLQRLWWVDIRGQRLHCMNEAGAERRSWDLPQVPGCVALTEEPRWVVLGLRTGIFTFDTETGSLALLAVARGWRLPCGELAARCGLTPGGIRRRFDALERDGLVERRREGRDPRWFAVLTLDGKRRLDAATPAYLESVRRHFFDQLDRDELRRLAAALERVARNVREETGATGSTDG